MVVFLFCVAEPFFIKTSIPSAYDENVIVRRINYFLNQFPGGIISSWE